MQRKVYLSQGQTSSYSKALRFIYFTTSGALDQQRKTKQLAMRVRYEALSQPQYKTLVNKVHPSMQTTPLPGGLDMIISDLHLIQVVFFREISNSH